MSMNPLHALIEHLEQYIRAVWRCHHASTKEEKDQAVQAWLTLKTPFWNTYRIPSEAIRGLTDPALAWCCGKGFSSAEHIATVEQSVYFITELAMVTIPTAMPSVYSKPDKFQNRWEGEGRLLIDASAVQNALRRLAALTGNEWKWHGRLPWDPPLEDGPNHRPPDESTAQATPRDLLDAQTPLPSPPKVAEIVPGIVKGAGTDSSALPVATESASSGTTGNTPAPLHNADHSSDPTEGPWLHIASDVRDLGSPRDCGAFVVWCDRHIKTLENVRKALAEKGDGEPFASIHLCSEIVLECIQCLNDFEFTALAESPWVIHLLDKQEPELIREWLALGKGGEGVWFDSPLCPWLENAQHLLEESSRLCVASGTQSEPAEKLKQYRRGPEAKKAKAAKRNALIDQAKSEGIVKEDEIFKYVQEKDATLLATNKRGKGFHLTLNR